MIYRHIAIDLDNTIINYNNLFKIEYLKLFNSKNSLEIINPKKNNQDFKNILKEEIGEIKWQKFQGKLYSKLILNADLFEGFEEFLKLCKFYKIKINIISHKTRFGHFDKSKTDIRKMALIFLKRKNILNKLISVKNIFFCDSEEEKIKKINFVKCDLIIDDLSKILLNKNLNKNIEKIYFGKKKTNISLKNFQNWFEIINHIFESKNDYLANKLKQIYKKSYDFEYPRSFNAKIVFFKNKEKSLVYKDYNFSEMAQMRFKREKLAYEIFFRNNINCIPKFFKVDEKNNSIIIEYINGRKTKKISKFVLDCYISFFEIISKIKYKKKDILFASSNAITFDNISKDIHKRVLDIQDYNNSFIKKYLNLIEKKIYYIQSQKYNNFYCEKILSISDVGIHNTITQNKNLVFYDFEYFGLDNKAKLLSDFILHPKNNLSFGQIMYFKDKFINTIVDDKKKFLKNLKIIFPLCSIIWALIILKKYNKRQLTVIDIKKIEYYLNFELNAYKYKI